MLAVEVLLVNSVRSDAIRQKMNTRINFGRSSKTVSCSPIQLERPVV